ncbi:UvrD-helicase domain-containing protein [Haliea sp. E1-2-M8]|uniref:UvrD-helicase domain-containing protein n=1 Tax=Haliea sp. E1-2-M8 TaxID=3064706 RepID=UPI002715E04C|nr:UvrD-helicase domain-containing protein [Haliea sp. E1-2-M8]MDO8862351.1 UvrD-helicase domain-containing protein [Haliea sp. E1-2-M8]
MTVSDAWQRERALDTAGSFCVSAPAGSGKTELLIQRYLALLSRVSLPEQVLAITFTRKAAAEMRDRVVAALEAAAAGEPVTGSHEQRTRELAQAALVHGTQLGWQLLRDTARFNIRTIDGFCHALTRQMPVLSRFGGQASAVDDARELYAEAVIGLFRLLEEGHPVVPDLEALLLHFGNDWARLQELLSALLARREQWQDYVSLRHDPAWAEAVLRETLDHLVRDRLRRLAAALAPVAGELKALREYAAVQLGQPAPGDLSAAGGESLTAWRGVATLLLKADGQWRSRVDKRQGFPGAGVPAAGVPAAGVPAGKGAARDWKERMQALLAGLAGQETLRRDLRDLAVLPAADPEDNGWQLLLHLFHVLPVLAAQLLLVFQQRGQVDHTQIALYALQALGEDEAPTDLALRLDYRIEHLLVDEFQDTAINQYRLLQRLTRGWGEHNALQPERPRTLLLVGDGMQSIYGFRDANVGLFLRARDEGFNGVVPEYLMLASNFRSRAGIVDWVNAVFQQAFPAVDDIARGEVRFTPAVATRAAGTEPAVALEVFADEPAPGALREAALLADRIAAALDDAADTTVAVLARSRGQLQPVLAALRAAGISYNAQDIDSLARNPVVADLFTLCRALANPADRVAWMALLRAPWCALEPADLLRVAQYGAAASRQPLASTLQDPAMRAQLSPAGRERLVPVAAALAEAFRRRDRRGLRVWLELLWEQLGGPACAGSETDLHNAERFLQLLEQADSEGRGLDLPSLQRRLAGLYARSGDTSARVQVMTLHRAKGLEFDHVFLPGLAGRPRADERPALLWDDYTDADGARRFLLATDDHSERDSPGVYNTLLRIRRHKSRVENARLLYVGATRAIRTLTLSAVLAPDPATDSGVRAPSADALLAGVWDALAAQAKVHWLDEGAPR